MILTDAHVHSNFSPDSRALMQEVINQAKGKGVKRLYFTDHYEFDNPDISKDQMLALDVYEKTIKGFQSLEEKNIDIKMGIEFGLQPHISEHLNLIAKTYDFDFILGSSHMIEKMDVGFDASLFKKGKSQEEFYQAYFNEIERCLQSIDCFDVYGHLDYIIRYGGYAQRELNFSLHYERLESILKTLIHRGKGIEVNTSGKRYGLKDFHPSEEILSLYHRLGGEIVTLGSDAHRAEDVASYFKEASELLEKIGFRYYTYFVKRRPHFERI